MAKDRHRLTWDQLALRLDMIHSENTFLKTNKRLRQGHAWDFHTFIKIARLAGLSDLDAAKVWCREQLPDKYENLKYRVVTIRHKVLKKEDWRKPFLRDADLDALLTESLEHLED